MVDQKRFAEALAEALEGALEGPLADALASAFASMVVGMSSIDGEILLNIQTPSGCVEIELVRFADLMRSAIAAGLREALESPAVLKSLGLGTQQHDARVVAQLVGLDSRLANLEKQAGLPVQHTVPVHTRSEAAIVH